MIYSSFPLINSVIDGLQEGEIFYHKGFSLIYHKAGFSYLSGEYESDQAGVLGFFLMPGQFPDYFHVYDASDRLIAICKEASQFINIRIRKRIQLKFQDVQLPLTNRLPSGYSLKRIDSDNFIELAGFNLSIETKFWKSQDDFLKNGFGFTVNNESGVPVSICYSACIANKTAEIDVATLPHHQKMGLAKLVVGRFVQHCLENDIIANWDCFEDNHGSLKTAESIGFKRISIYNFLSIFNKTRKS